MNATVIIELLIEAWYWIDCGRLASAKRVEGSSHGVVELGGAYLTVRSRDAHLPNSKRHPSVVRLLRCRSSYKHPSPFRSMRIQHQFLAKHIIIISIQHLASSESCMIVDCINSYQSQPPCPQSFCPLPGMRGLQRIAKQPEEQPRKASKRLVRLGGRPQPGSKTPQTV